MIDKIMRGMFSFPGVLWAQVTENGKDFVSKLLVVDPKERMNAKQALGHAWQKEQNSLSDRRPTEDLMKQVQENLIAYKDTSDLKKLALNVSDLASIVTSLKLRLTTCLGHCTQVFDRGNCAAQAGLRSV